MEDLFGLDSENNNILAHLDDEALHQKHLWPGDLVELADVIQGQLKREGIQGDAVYQQVERILLAMSFICGGRNYYLPKGDRIKKALRDKRLYDEFSGKNIRELSERYDMSAQAVYTVLREQRQLHRERVQHNLFPVEQG